MLQRIAGCSRHGLHDHVALQESTIMNSLDVDLNSEKAPLTPTAAYLAYALA